MSLYCTETYIGPLRDIERGFLEIKHLPSRNIMVVRVHRIGTEDTGICSQKSLRG
jgi:hypothetical protein